MGDRNRNTTNIFIFLPLEAGYGSYEKFSVTSSWKKSLVKNILESLVTIKGKKRESSGSNKNADNSIVS